MADCGSGSCRRDHARQYGNCCIPFFVNKNNYIFNPVRFIADTPLSSSKETKMKSINNLALAQADLYNEDFDDIVMLFVRCREHLLVDNRRLIRDFQVEEITGHYSLAIRWIVPTFRF